MSPVFRSLVLAAACTGLLACGGGSGDDSTPADADDATVQRYEVDGIVRQLPGSGGKELMIRHVAIPDFVNARGDTIGMDAMTMGFPLADGVDLSAIAPGDTVVFNFEVNWDGSPPLRLTAMRPRTAGGALFFGKVGETPQP